MNEIEVDVHLEKEMNFQMEIGETSFLMNMKLLGSGVDGYCLEAENGRMLLIPHHNVMFMEVHTQLKKTGYWNE